MRSRLIGKPGEKKHIFLGKPLAFKALMRVSRNSFIIIVSLYLMKLMHLIIY